MTAGSKANSERRPDGRGASSRPSSLPAVPIARSSAPADRGPATAAPLGSSPDGSTRVREPGTACATSGCARGSIRIVQPRRCSACSRFANAASPASAPPQPGSRSRSEVPFGMGSVSHAAAPRPSVPARTRPAASAPRIEPGRRTDVPRFLGPVVSGKTARAHLDAVKGRAEALRMWRTDGPV